MYLFLCQFGLKQIIWVDFINPGTLHQLQLPVLFSRAPIWDNLGTKTAVKIVGSLSWRVLQIRKADCSSVIFFSPLQYSSWMEMASQVSFNLNAGLIPMLRPGRELPGIFGKQTSPWKWQNVWNPSARFLLCHMRGAGFFSFSCPLSRTAPQTSPFI